jgi:hypothetical protein
MITSPLMGRHDRIRYFGIGEETEVLVDFPGEPTKRSNPESR